MIRSWLVAVFMVAILGVAVSGCGVDKEQVAAEKKAAAAKRERARDLKAFEACDAQFSDLLDSLSALGSRLDVGLSYSQYGDKVGDVKVKYDEAFASLPTDGSKGTISCLGDVGVPAEKSLNSYIKASNTWSKCFDDPVCDNDSIKSKLQTSWSRATVQTEAAKAGLAAMNPSSS